MTPVPAVMILLGATCGLRIAEIAKVHHRDIGEDTLRVLGKGNRERMVPLSDATRQADSRAGRRTAETVVPRDEDVIRPRAAQQRCPGALTNPLIQQGVQPMQNVAPQIVTIPRGALSAVPAGQITDAPHFPATAVDGTGFDLAVEFRARDPYIGDCPSWCEDKDGGHEVSGMEEDRVHRSRAYTVPLRLHPFEFVKEAGSAVRFHLQTVDVYLDRDDLARDPIVRVDRSDACRGGEQGQADLALTLSEASALGQKLLQLARLGSESR